MSEKRSEMLRELRADAGISALELLVALAILALATVAAVNWIRFPDTSLAQSPVELFQAFVDAARRDVLQSGAAEALVIEDGRAQAGDRQISWHASDMRILARDQGTFPIQIALFPDGTASGPRVDIVTSEKSVPVRLVYRAPP